ncbi:hypothetical protein JR316_0010812 [Psilocybe cubensis]|uniref:Uncharacterized protein n=2 Tax=Psilocybe cubensis TaxID=181762 RepID=A0ACB8GMW3_PSICU|nr:hypothetical protein JR316_0010812 [Psilocybe cubensis]KAH9476896.1 hypothetical protein JR316_0010812 [Psilocybe cubensis]
MLLTPCLLRELICVLTLTPDVRNKMPYLSAKVSELPLPLSSVHIAVYGDTETISQNHLSYTFTSTTYLPQITHQSSTSLKVLDIFSTPTSASSFFSTVSSASITTSTASALPSNYPITSPNVRDTQPLGSFFSANGMFPHLFAGAGTAGAFLLLLAAYQLIQHALAACRRRRRPPSIQLAGIQNMKKQMYGRLTSRLSENRNDNRDSSVEQEEHRDNDIEARAARAEDGGAVALPLTLQMCVSRLEARVQHLERVLEGRTGGASAMRPISVAIAAQARVPTPAQCSTGMNTDIETETATEINRRIVTGMEHGSTAPNAASTAELTTPSVVRAPSISQCREDSVAQCDASPATASPQPTITSLSALSYTTGTRRESRAESVDSISGRSSPPEYRSREASLVATRSLIDERPSSSRSSTGTANRA